MGRTLKIQPPHGAGELPCSKCCADLPVSDFYWTREGQRRGSACKACWRTYDRKERKPRGEIPCVICEELFQPRPDGGSDRYCSDACFVEGRRRRARARWAAANPKPDRVCPHCGDSLSPDKRTDASFCSIACEQAAHNATRKAAWKIGEPVEYVSRAEIIARDDSTCHLCGKRCEDGEIHLDHVIPLARGGTHDRSNLAVACAPCNLSKGARARDDQLLLVA